MWYIFSFGIFRVHQPCASLYCPNLLSIHFCLASFTFQLTISVQERTKCVGVATLLAWPLLRKLHFSCLWEDEEGALLHRTCEGTVRHNEHPNTHQHHRTHRMCCLGVAKIRCTPFCPKRARVYVCVYVCVCVHAQTHTTRDDCIACTAQVAQSLRSCFKRFCFFIPFSYDFL